jgi:hypothetical protein
MKRHVTLNLLLLTILFAQLIQAGGVGISPAFYKEFFEPNLTKTYSFHSFNADPTKGINTYVRGDLAQYVNLSTKYMKGGGRFTVTIALPEKIDKPGRHTILIGVIEAEQETANDVIGGIAAVQGRIDILVPYPGKYAESTFIIYNINEGEDAKYKIKSQNLGTQNLSVNAKIEIYKVNGTETILIKTFNQTTLSPKEILTIEGTLATANLPPGEYEAIATIDWGNPEVINQTFLVGQFLVEIIDYDYQFQQGKINPFNIKIQNRWNTRINQVFASVLITELDDGKVVGSFKTVTVDTSPWEIKNITGYLDTTSLKVKRYRAKIEVSYAGAKTSKLIAIYINPPIAKTYRNYIIIAAIIALLIIAAFIYLIWKVRKLSIRNGKKK